MPPKLTKSAKQALIVSHLQATRTCHTIKDLEKMLPAVASINGMQVKEYVSELVDENKIRVEKIGSGNWYWCFGGEEKKERERELGLLRREVERVRVCYGEVEGRVEERKKKARMGSEDEDEWRALNGRKTRLEDEVRELQGELRALVGGEEEEGGKGKGVQAMRDETAQFRQRAQLWTDNLYVLEQYLARLAGGDREIIRAVQRECYGEEWDEEEGLRDMN